MVVLCSNARNSWCHFFHSRRLFASTLSHSCDSTYPCRHRGTMHIAPIPFLVSRIISSKCLGRYYHILSFSSLPHLQHELCQWETSLVYWSIIICHHLLYIRGITIRTFLARDPQRTNPTSTNESSAAKSSFNFPSRQIPGSMLRVACTSTTLPINTGPEWLRQKQTPER